MKLKTAMTNRKMHKKIHVFETFSIDGTVAIAALFPHGMDGRE